MPYPTSVDTGEATNANQTTIIGHVDGIETGIGAPGDTKVTNSDSSASTIAALKGLLTLLAWGQDTKANSIPVTIASDQEPLKAATAPRGSVAAATSSTTIFASNANAKGRSAFNDSSAILYLDESGGAATTSNYTVQVQPYQLYEFPQPIYTGMVTGVWSSATGAVKTKELT